MRPGPSCPRCGGPTVRMVTEKWFGAVYVCGHCNTSWSRAKNLKKRPKK